MHVFNPAQWALSLFYYPFWKLHMQNSEQRVSGKQDSEMVAHVKAIFQWIF